MLNLLRSPITSPVAMSEKVGRVSPRPPRTAAESRPYLSYPRAAESRPYLLALVLNLSATLAIAQTTFDPARVVVRPTAMPPAAYINDWYAPPPDCVPQQAIAAYSLNTRVPDYFWLPYDGAHALALRIRPIAREKLEQQIAAKLIDPAKNPETLTFNLATESDEAARTVVIANLNQPADDFVALAFKLKVRARNAGTGLKVVAQGVTTLLTEEHADPETACQDGFRAYKIAFPARKSARLRDLALVVAPATAADFEQEFVIIDLHFKRAAPQPRFDDIPPRRWIRKAVFEAGREPTESDAIPDIRAFVEAQPAEFPSLKLPTAPYTLRPQSEKESDGGFKAEQVQVKLGEREVEALRITLSHGPRCYLKFPLTFDATDYNTLTLFAKVEVPAGARPLQGDRKPMLWGSDAATLNKPFDTFGVGLYSATHDYEDWGRWGVMQAMYTQNLELDAAAPDGWRLLAYDFVNGAPSGNKSAFYPKITHWTFYYDNRKLAPGEEVVITIAAPLATKGLMQSGGDLAAYRQFLAERPLWSLLTPGDKIKALDPPATNRLTTPIRFIENHLPQGSVYLDIADVPEVHRQVVRRAASTLVDLLGRKYGALAPIPLLEKRPPKEVTKAVIIGGNAFRVVDKEQYGADIKALQGTPGCAIRSDGTNVYIYAAPCNYAGAARGLANGIYTFLENNTDVIFAFADKETPQGADVVFDLSPDGNFDIVWGRDYLNLPPLQLWGASGVPAWHNDHNRAARTSVWGDSEYAGFRGRSCNHWWGYGTGSNGLKGEPNETWGIGEDGQPMLPGCYTGHPCLIRVLEPAKEAYVQASGFAPVKDQYPAGEGFAWNSYDVHGLWVEDTLKVCQCALCALPLRLPDGSLVQRDEEEFLSTQFYANGCAMINAVNVYANRQARIESIAYFWMTRVPRLPLSRNYNVRFCPYIRKDYFEPIYAPSNDIWWRELVRWSQLDVKLDLYEYFLFIQARPWADVFAYDLAAFAALGVSDAILEGDSGPQAMLERWVVTRLMWEPQQRVADLRATFIQRTFREAAPEMERFFTTLYSLVYRDYAPFKPMEFEDLHDFGRLALRTKSGRQTVADELDELIAAAGQRVKNPAAAQQLARFREAWEKYMAAARQAHAANPPTQ